MKIKYTNQQKDKEPIFEAQIKMRQAKAKKFPAFKLFIGTIVAVLAIWAAIAFIREQSIYSYGIVHGKAEYCKVPFAGTIRATNLIRGRYVEKGEALFSVDSTDGGIAIANILERLNSKRRRLMKLQTQNDFEFSDPVLADLNRRLSEAETDLVNSQAQYSIQIERARSALDNTEREKTMFKTIVDHKAGRYENIKHLVELGGAVADTLKTADVERAIAIKNYDVAQANINLLKLELQTVEQTNNDVIKSKQKVVELFKSDIKKQLESNRVSADYADQFQHNERELLIREIKLLQSVVDKSAGGTFTYHAPFSGIVTESMIGEGSLVSEGQVVVTFVSTSDYWIDAYIPPRQKSIYDTAAKARILTPDDGRTEAIIDRSTQLFEVKVPEQLQTRMPTTLTALYTRLTPDRSLVLPPGSIVKIIIR